MFFLIASFCKKKILGNQMNSASLGQLGNLTNPFQRKGESYHPGLPNFGYFGN